MGTTVAQPPYDTRNDKPGRRVQGTAQAYIVSKNLHRRHFNESQRAMIAAKMANLKNGQRAGQTAGVKISTPRFPRSKHRKC
jgi:hypothetical protein